MRRWLLVAALLIAAAGCGKRKPPPPPPPAVGVVTAELTAAPLTSSLVGRLSALLSANVNARVSGVLLERKYAEGSTVKRGQVLFEIDPVYYKTVLDTDLGVLAEDQAAYVDAKVTADRDRQLLPVGSVSQQTVDDANATELSDAAKIRADEAAVEGARINLGYTKIRSPIAGVAGQQQLTQGALVGSSTSDAGSSGTLLTTVDQIDSLYVNFTVSAADLVTWRQAQQQGKLALAQQNKTKIQVILPNGSAYGPLGTLDFSDVVVNATTGAVNLRALLPNPRHELLPGMFVTLSVTFGQQNQIFLIPQQSLQRDTVGAFVLVVGPNDKVLRKNVTANDSDGNDWIVTSGLAAGDRVVVSGVQVAAVGAQVTPSPWTAAGPAGPGPAAVAATAAVNP
jgi:membrane fusion protein (multidrug efflux system)